MQQTGTGKELRTVSEEDAAAEVDRASASACLKDALAMLLEVRPADPMLFFAEYFKGAAQPEATPLALIRACPRSRPCFHDNLHRAFASLQESVGTAVGTATVVQPDCSPLLFQLCETLPRVVSMTLVDEMMLASHRPWTFSEFRKAVEACLAAEDAFLALSRLFEACDPNGMGALPRDRLLAELEAQQNVHQAMRLQRAQEWQQQRQQCEAQRCWCSEGVEGGAEIEAIVGPSPSQSRSRIADQPIEFGSGMEPELPPLEVLRAKLASRGLAASDAVRVDDLFAVAWQYICEDPWLPEHTLSVS